MKNVHNFFRVDMSAYAEFLSTLSVGSLSDDERVSLAAIMGNDDPKGGRGLWVADAPGTEFSLAEASVIYAGPNDDILPTNPLYSHVVGISLGEFSDEIRQVYLHYNAQ